MATLLTLDHVSVTRRGRVVLDGVDLTVATGDRLALLGRNGAGKTTLLDVLGSRLKPDEGERWTADGLRVAYLPQHPTFEGGRTVGELVRAANPHLERQTALADLAARLDSEPHLLDTWAEAQATFEAAGGYRYDVTASVTLGILSLTGFQDRDAATLSGGERTRLALALALLRQPDLLLLDEPTNHLDLRMREWLESTLLSWPGAVVLTSHDRELLDRAVTRSVWLEEGAATHYTGGYTSARTQRDVARRTQAKMHRLNRREETRLASAAARESRWGRHADPLRSRALRVEVPEAPLPERRVRMRLLGGDTRAKVLVWAEHLTKRYGTRVILDDVALKIRQGDRVVLLGANGTGKTTLLRLLSGETYADHAEAKLHYEQGVTVAYLDQTWHGLHADAPLRTQFVDRFGDARANALLGRAGFGSDDWPKTPRQLSGGERARAGLALIGGLRADLLLLDEPTNHLDVEALEALEHALQAYSGAAIIVTHDRRFARGVATRVWRIDDARLIETADLSARDALDPARALHDDPPPPPPPPSPADRMRQLEDRLRELDATLTFARLTGREEARVRSDRHETRQALSEAYDVVYGEEVFDHEVPARPVHVRGVRVGAGGMFWVRAARECPHLAWSGEVLSWRGTRAEAWFAEAITGGALRILFEHWNVHRVTFPGGASLTRDEYLSASGLAWQGPHESGASKAGASVYTVARGRRTEGAPRRRRRFRRALHARR